MQQDVQASKYLEMYSEISNLTILQQSVLRMLQIVHRSKSYRHILDIMKLNTREVRKFKEIAEKLLGKRNKKESMTELNMALKRLATQPLSKRREIIDDYSYKKYSLRATKLRQYYSKVIRNLLPDPRGFS